jgi:putative hydrolase of the HAD superfamily
MGHFRRSRGAQPGPEIFRFAAARAGQPLNGAWIIGDSAEADVTGARNTDLPVVWLDRSRPWPLTAFHPDHIADSFPSAVRIILGTGT